MCPPCSVPGFLEGVFPPPAGILVHFAEPSTGAGSRLKQTVDRGFGVTTTRTRRCEITSAVGNGAALGLEAKLCEAAARQPDIGRRCDQARVAGEKENPSLRGVLPKDYAGFPVVEP